MTTTATCLGYGEFWGKCGRKAIRGFCERCNSCREELDQYREILQVPII